MSKENERSRKPPPRARRLHEGKAGDEKLPQAGGDCGATIRWAVAAVDEQQVLRFAQDDKSYGDKP
jgi:hypothetical protein